MVRCECRVRVIFCVQTRGGVSMISTIFRGVSAVSWPFRALTRGGVAANFRIVDVVVKARNEDLVHGRIWAVD